MQTEPSRKAGWKGKRFPSFPFPTAPRIRNISAFCLALSEKRALLAPGEGFLYKGSSGAGFTWRPTKCGRRKGHRKGCLGLSPCAEGRYHGWEGTLPEILASCCQPGLDNTRLDAASQSWTVFAQMPPVRAGQYPPRCCQPGLDNTGTCCPSGLGEACPEAASRGLKILGLDAVRARQY